jgi:hypothetical protein
VKKGVGVWAGQGVQQDGGGGRKSAGETERERVCKDRTVDGAASPKEATLDIGDAAHCTYMHHHPAAQHATPPNQQATRINRHYVHAAMLMLQVRDAMCVQL